MTSPLPCPCVPRDPLIRPLLPVPCPSLRACSEALRLIRSFRFDFPGPLVFSLFRSAQLSRRSRSNPGRAFEGCSWLLSADVNLTPERSVILLSSPLARPHPLMLLLLARQQLLLPRLGLSSSSARAITAVLSSIERRRHSLRHFQRCMRWDDSQRREERQDTVVGVSSVRAARQ
jgi:hypothetical protein